MDSTPTALFNSYEQDFRAIIQEVQLSLEPKGKELKGEPRKAALRKAEIQLDEADDLVSQLEVEIQGIPQSIKAQYSPRLKQAKADLARYKKLSKDLQNQASRADLLGKFSSTGRGPASDDPYGEDSSDRQRLLAGNATLEDGSRRLQDSTRVALLAEEQGGDILRTLRGQREQIEYSRDTLGKADIHIDRATGTLKGMIRQMYKQKVILSSIGALFIILVLFILYFKLVR